MKEKAESSWLRLCPAEGVADGVVSEVDAWLRKPGTEAELAELDSQERYPRALLDELWDLGVASVFVDAEPEAPRPRATPYHQNALLAVASRAGGSLAITLGVNSLALLPAYIGATASQREWIFAKLRKRGLCSILLTERDHGSNLLRNETYAEIGTLLRSRFVPRAELGEESDGERLYRIRGEKHLINGGGEHALLFTLVRTGSSGTASGDTGGADGEFSLFFVERDESVRCTRRWRTLPAAAADISDVRFEDTLVPVANRLGAEGRGLDLVVKTLSLSRGGISALAAGCASRAAELATLYAGTRDVYGGPILALDAIAEHVIRVQALELTTNALAVKQAVLANAVGRGASYYTAVAKYACCALAEEAVDEGRRLLSARALLRDLPYERLVRDVLLYPVFDGTPHVMLEIIAKAASRIEGRREACTLSLLRDWLARRPRSIVTAARDARPGVLLPLAPHARALADLAGDAELEPLAKLVDAFVRAQRALRASRAWGDQSLRFAAAELLAHLEALVALVELADPERRSALGARPMGGPRAPEEPHRARYRYALGWLGARAASRVRRLGLRTGIDGVAELDAIESAFLQEQEEGRRRLVPLLREATPR